MGGRDSEMAENEISLKTLKFAVNSVLDHLMEDVGLKTVSIDPDHDFYWHCSAPGIYDASTQPTEKDLTIGRLSDDMHFIGSVQRGQSADASINLVHVAPLLRYIADTIGQ
jgi:hypothetical protein